MLANTSNQNYLHQQHQYRYKYKASGKPEHIVKERERIAALPHSEKKEALKEKRRLDYQSQQERKERQITRRVGRNRGTKKFDFNRFFIRKKVDEEYMHRKARQGGLEWDYRIATIIQRCDIVLPDLTDWEKDYQTLRDHLDQYGKVYPEEITGKIDYDNMRIPTEEEMLASLPFTPAPRETEADMNGDVRTTNRRLKGSVFLLVRQDQKWQFPTVGLSKEETCLDAARRSIPETISESVKYWCPSPCPWSVHLAPFPEEQRKETGLYGVKTFFMLVQHDKGEVVELKADTGVEDYAWLDRGEVVERILEQNGENMSKLYHYMLL